MPTIKVLQTKRKFLFTIGPSHLFQTGAGDPSGNPDNSARGAGPRHDR